jgi:hypothetical protein
LYLIGRSLRRAGPRCVNTLISQRIHDRAEAARRIHSDRAITMDAIQEAISATSNALNEFDSF